MCHCAPPAGRAPVHRARPFPVSRPYLPAFADDDPRTVEVLSKILRLARDKEIKGPSILEQIRAM
jgi:hypothetical protein